MEYKYDYDDDKIFQNEYQLHHQVPMIHLDFEDEYLPKIHSKSQIRYSSSPFQQVFFAD